jgi:hypothetical protein
MPPHVKLFVYIFVGLGGCLFGICLFLAGRQSPAWARGCFVALGLLALTYGVLGFALEHHRASLPYPTRLTLDHYKTLVAGIAIGVLAVLGISGQFKIPVKPRTET